MKPLFTLLFLGAFFFLMTSLKSDHPKDNPENKIEMPSAVKKTIDTSCFMCHNLESKNEKGKKALAFDNLHMQSKMKQIGKFSEIAEEVEEGHMPPAKFLDHKPEAKLTPEDKKALIDWANNSVKKLMEK